MPTSLVGLVGLVGLFLIVPAGPAWAAPGATTTTTPGPPVTAPSPPVTAPGPPVTAPTPPVTSPSPPAGAANPPAGTIAPPDLAAIQAYISALASQIASQQQRVEALSEQYDQATVLLSRVRSQLAQTAAAIEATRLRLANARHRLELDSINAYTHDEPTNDVIALLGGNSDDTRRRSVYEAAAIGNLGRDVAVTEATKRQLTATESTQHAQEQQAGAQAAMVQRAHQAAQQAAQDAEATLASAQGYSAAVAAAQAAGQAAQEAAGQFMLGPVGDGSPPHGAGALALQVAELFLGVPYVWGGESLSGVDCSGLTMLAWSAAGASLVHSAALQYDATTRVPFAQVQPGDLLFYYNLDNDNTIDHVVMYVGSGPFGASTIIQAAHTGTVVSFDPISYVGLVAAGRP